MNRKFRLGTTSFIFSDDMLSNARQLAGQIDDIELVLFDTQDYGNNLPSKYVVQELRALASANALTFTVHLPVDLDWRDERSSEKISRAIDATHLLDPFAYVMHLDGRPVMDEPSPEMIAEWQYQTARVLDQIIARVERGKLCVENLERWSPELFADMIAEKNVARCIDVGHLWKQQRDPMPHLREHIVRTRIIHIHGVGERDHQSLALQSREQVRPVFDFLNEADFDGVVTLEIFSLDDLVSSKCVVAEWANGLH